MEEKHGRHRIAVCMGTSCRARGAEQVLDKLLNGVQNNSEGCPEKEKYTVEACGCLHLCNRAPVVAVNGDIYFEVTADGEKICQIIDLANQC